MKTHRKRGEQLKDWKRVGVEMVRMTTVRSTKKQTDQERMDEFFETTSYGGPVQDWRTTPELGTSPDEPDYREVVRAVAAKKEKKKRASK